MDTLPNWLNITLVIAGALGTLITAIATVFLWIVTKILARETTLMAKASAQPHVVATLTPNKWSVIHFDLNIDNSGNSPAYDIKICFDPPLENDEIRKDYKIPFKNISVLKPGQRLSSFLTDYQSLKGKSFNVKISWKNKFESTQTEENNYTLSMNDYEGVSRLGDEPLNQIAKHVKKLEESFSSISRGHRKLKVDTFSSNDRKRESRRIKERMEERRRHKEHKVNERSSSADS